MQEEPFLFMTYIVFQEMTVRTIHTFFDKYQGDISGETK